MGLQVDQRQLHGAGVLGVVQDGQADGGSARRAGDGVAGPVRAGEVHAQTVAGRDVHPGGPHIDLDLDGLTRDERVAAIRAATRGQAQRPVGEQDRGAVRQDLGEAGVQVGVLGVGRDPGAQGRAR